MNKIISILICCFIAGCLFVSCEQPDIPDVPNYDKTEILTFKVYNQDKEEVGTPVILSDEGVVTITVDEGTNLSMSLPPAPSLPELPCLPHSEVIRTGVG